MAVTDSAAAPQAMLRLERRVQRQGACVARMRGRGFRLSDLGALYSLRALLGEWDAALRERGGVADLVQSTAIRNFVAGTLAIEIKSLERLRK